MHMLHEPIVKKTDVAYALGEQLHSNKLAAILDSEGVWRADRHSSTSQTKTVTLHKVKVT